MSTRRVSLSLSLSLSIVGAVELTACGARAQACPTVPVEEAPTCPSGTGGWDCNTLLSYFSDVHWTEMGQCVPNPGTNGSWWLPEECAAAGAECPQCADGGLCCAEAQAAYTQPPFTSCNRRVVTCDVATCGWWGHYPCPLGGHGTDHVRVNWRGYEDLGGDCPECGGEAIELCANGIDDDCDGELDEHDYGDCIVDVPCDLEGDRANAQCAGTCRHRGGPVDLWTRRMFAGPYEVARVQSDQGGSADLSFDLLFDSLRGDGEDNGVKKADGTEAPQVLDVSPGFRHRFADRLIVRNGGSPAEPHVVIWDGLHGRVHFFRVSSTQWKAEPGTNAMIYQSGGTWRLLTPGGDVLEFVDTTDGTSNHPHDLWGHDDHVRLRNIFPGATPGRRILLLYEDDDIDDAAPYEADQIPGPLCTDLVPGATAANCTEARGLLVKVGVVYGAEAPFFHGPSFELKYTFGGGGTAPQQFLISEIKNGAARIDGGTPYAYATLGYTSTTPRRLETVKDKVACTASNDSCTALKLAYSGGNLTTVYRPGTTATGTSPVLLAEESFSWSGSLVTGHSSPGVTLGYSGTDAGQEIMSWTKNGTPFDFRFDLRGNPLTCSDGSCGEAGQEKLYQASEDFVGLFTLGPSAQQNVDGTWTFRRYTERGNVDLECTVVPTSARVAPTCALGVDLKGAQAPLGGDQVVITGGVMRSIERRYYEVVAAGAERLRAVAVYDPDTINTDYEMPLSMPSSWQTVHSSIASCATIDPIYVSARTNKLSVTVYDYNSNGGTTFDESALSSTTMPDLLPLRVNRAAASDGSSSTPRICSTWERDDQGRVVMVRELSSAVIRRRIGFAYHPIPAETTASSGRLASVTRYRGAQATDPIITLQTCAASTRYDMEGRLACFEVPQATGAAMTVSQTLLAGNSVYAQRRVTQVSGGGATASTYRNELASGFAFESGVGDGSATGAAEGNRVRTLFDRGGSAARQTTVGAVEHYDSSLSSSGLVWKSTETHNSYGVPVTSRVYLGSSTLRAQQERSAIDEEGRAEQVQHWVTSTTSVSTGYAYAAPGWDALTDVWEADGDHVEYGYGGLGSPAADFGRQRYQWRGNVALQKTEHTRDGAIKRIANPALAGGTIAAGEYTYDPLRRLIKEDRQTAGQVVEYAWLDDTRVSQRVVKGTNGTVIEDLRYTYDRLGRLASIASNATGSLITVRTIKYDDKGSFAGTWNGVTMTSDFNRDRVAYVEDQSGATFYEYDGAGRTRAIIRYEGPLSGWNPTANPLKAIRFGYGPAGELWSITYPSGLVVTYDYGNDKERPTRVSTSTLGTVACGITYEPSGAPSWWSYECAGGRDRTVSRDFLGRVTRILDRYGAATWSDVYYTYDADGDVLTEMDLSPARTWLRSSSTAPQTRTYTYDTSHQRDMLKSWVDDGTAESVVYLGDGRRYSETDGSTTYTYDYDDTYPERLLSKTNSSTTTEQEVAYGYQASDGRITRVDQSADGDWDTTFTYGHFGQVATRTTSAGTNTDKYDFEMRLVGVDEPTGYTRRMRYAFGRAPLEETRTTTSGTWRWETIYLAGEAIAQVATSPTASAALRNLHTDRMGVVRKTATTGGTSLQRKVFDAWGGSNSAVGTGPIDNIVDPMPSVSWMYPGQYYTGSNGWRQYLPLVGQYAGVEPRHALTASAFVGPQAYTYAAARPFRLVDRNGAWVDGNPRDTSPEEYAIGAPIVAVGLGAPLAGALGVGGGAAAVLAVVPPAAVPAVAATATVCTGVGLALADQGTPVGGRTISLVEGYVTAVGSPVKFSPYYFNHLLATGRKWPFLMAEEMLETWTSRSPDRLPGFLKYENGILEMVYNPETGEVWHLSWQ